MSNTLVTTYRQAKEKLEGLAMPNHLERFRKAVTGKRIVGAGYSIEYGEAWPVIMLEDGGVITASMDDEGNGPGVLHGPDASVLCQTNPKK